MAKKLSLLVVFLVAGVGALTAQSTVDLTNNSGNISYDASGIRFYAKVPGGAIYLYTGPGSLPSLGPSDTLYANGGSCFSYNVSSVGSGLTANVSGSMALLSAATNGSNSLSTYQLTLSFSGYDTNGVPFNGTTIQMLKVKTGQKGDISITSVGGTTDLTY